MKNLEKMNEAELRDHKPEWPKTEEEMLGQIRSLVKREHDYGTCVYAMSIAATAAFHYVARKLGVTGFQASCADMDIITKIRGWKRFRMVNYENLLYPQYLNEKHFPTLETLLKENGEWLKTEAERLLKESTSAHPDVLTHWEKLASWKK